MAFRHENTVAKATNGRLCTKNERTLFAQTLNKSFGRAFPKARTGGGREALLALRRARRQVAAPNHRGDTASVFNCKPRWVGFKKVLIFFDIHLRLYNQRKKWLREFTIQKMSAPCAKKQQ